MRSGGRVERQVNNTAKVATVQRRRLVRVVACRRWLVGASGDDCGATDGADGGGGNG